jgi:hypothetical protein
MQIQIRLAHLEDISALETLIPESARALQANYYTPAQIEGALGTVFGVDTQLIQDQTYFIAENTGQIIGCGGWSKRKTLYGGDHRAKHWKRLLHNSLDTPKIHSGSTARLVDTIRAMFLALTKLKWLKRLQNL